MLGLGGESESESLGRLASSIRNGILIIFGRRISILRVCIGQADQFAVFWRLLQEGTLWGVGWWVINIVLFLRLTVPPNASAPHLSIIQLYNLPNNFIPLSRMSTQPQSARLAKYSRLGSSGRRTSVSEYQPKQTFKLAALRSVNKGVKYNDLSFLTGKTLDKLRVDQGQSQDLQYVTSHEGLASIRKKHDDIKKQRIKREQELVRMKEELQNLKDMEKQYTSKKTDAKELTSDLEKAIVERRGVLEEASYEAKAMLHMAFRIREDKVIYDQRKYDLEKELEFLRKKLAIIHKQEKIIGQESDRTRKVYQKLVKQLQAEAKQRREHLDSLAESITTRQQFREVASGRQSQIADIAQRAMQDKDQNQKNWKNLQTVHKFVAYLLRDKMDRQMQKFKVVQTAFKNIKIATGTADTIQLVNKFLNKETVYGELLSKIADYEKKIEALKQEREGLERQRRLHEEELNQFETFKKGNEDLTKEFKLLENYEDRGKRVELEEEKMNKFVIKQLTKIYKRQGKSKPKYKELSTPEALEQLFQYLESNLDTIQQPIDDIKTDSLGKSQLEALKRVKTKKQTEEDIQQDTTAYDEDDFVANARNDLLKQNEKFMKELKKKTEAMIKLRMEMSPKKKEDAVPAPKAAAAAKVAEE